MAFREFAKPVIDKPVPGKHTGDIIAPRVRSQ
jgi:hypothetical protein